MVNAVEIFIEEHKSLMIPPIFGYELKHAYFLGSIPNYATGEMFSDSRRSLAGKMEEFNHFLSPMKGREFPFSLSAAEGSFEEAGDFAYLEFMRLFPGLHLSGFYFLLERRKAGNGIGGYYEGIWTFPGDEFPKISGMPKAEKLRFLRSLGAEEAILILEQKI